MSIFYLIIFFLFGLFVGSFLNCLIYRLSLGESFLRGRSYCPKCKHKLSWYDLIPLLSFFILKGKCRYCSAKISLQYPLVEFFSGLLFAFSALLIFLSPPTSLYQFFQFSFTILFYWFFISVLIIIFVYDLKYFIIPDKIIYPAILVSFIWRLISFRGLDPLFSAVGSGAFFLLIFLISRGKWLGLGDVKLVFFMGLLLGFPNILLSLFLAFSIGAIIGMGLIILGKKSLKDEIPFAPFLVIGTLIALFFGQNLINWYLELFL
jgi:prepilin signal peptidase PulO-like enzyme (type II secretory pathway)